MNGNLILATVLGAPIVAYFVGIHIGRVLRMRDHGWKIGVILASVIMGSAVTYFYWPPKRGIDLSGGVILVYEVDEEKTAPTPGQQEETGGAPVEPEGVDMGALVQALQRRINPTGVREVVILNEARDVRFIGNNHIDQRTVFVCLSHFHHLHTL